MSHLSVQGNPFTDAEVVELKALAAGGSIAPVWGGISGTLSDQTDLQLALDAKADDLGVDDNYVTDAEKVKLSNLSGINTGDQDLSPYFHKSNDDTDDITVGATNKFATAAEKTKLGHITVTQAVDLDTIESRVNSLDSAVVLQGSWDASAGTFPGGGAAEAGYSYIVTVAGTVDGVAFSINDRLLAVVDNASTGTYASNWLKLDYTDQVLSVAGKTGAVTLVAADITDITASASELNTLDGITATVTELNHTDGVTSNIQTQLNGKQATITDASISAGRLELTSPTILGKASGGTGSGVELTPAQVRTVAGLSSTDSPEFTGVNIGHASDTTITRVSAGKIAVEGVNVVTTSSTDTLSNKTLSAANLSGVQLLAENASIGLDPSLSADGTWAGITITATAGYTQAFGDLVYIDPTDSRWEAVDANAAAGADGDARGILGMVVVAGTDGNSCTILLNGVIRADANFPTFTVNNPIYASETAGDVTQTQPTTTDVVIRVVGFPLTADSMYFNPSPDYITHT